MQKCQVLSHRSQHIIYVWTSLCARGHCRVETGKCLPQNYCHKVGSTELSRMSLYAVALIFPFNGTKGPSLNHEKRPQTIKLTDCKPGWWSMLQYLSLHPRVQYSSLDCTVLHSIDCYRALHRIRNNSVTKQRLNYSTFLSCLLILMHRSTR